jgi:hypothetical protein
MTEQNKDEEVTEQREPSFDDVIAAIKQLAEETASIKSAFDRHEHNSSGAVLLRI